MSINATTYDYLVIGGGHNGLIAASYLAKTGASVVVLEQQPYLGGMAATQAYVASAPGHLLSQGAIDSVFIKTTPIIEELDLKRHGLALIDIDPGYGWINEDGETLLIFRDAARTAVDVGRYSLADARRYLDLQHAFARMMKLQMPFFGKAADAIGLLDVVKAALRTIGDRSTRQTLARLTACSAHEAIAATFESDPIRSLYAYWCEIAGAADVDGSGLNMASLSLMHQVGCSRPAGSMGGLIAALERSLISHGGIVKTNAGVERIVVEEDRARGIVLVDGAEIHARRGVLASCAPQVTYGRLLGADHQSANTRARLRFLPANANNMCPFKVDMAIGGPLHFGKAQKKRSQLDGVDIGATSLMTGSFDDHIEHITALRAGKMGRRPPIWMTVLSHADRSIAPNGQDVAFLYTSAPAGCDDNGESGSKSIAESLIAESSRYLDGLGAEIGRCITTPRDFEKQYSTPRGCLYHVDMSATRMMRGRPAFGMSSSLSDVAGLYLAGSGSHPGGGVFGMPGKLAARSALE